MRQIYKIAILSLFTYLCVFGNFTFAQPIYTFTAAGATGNTGPTQFMLDTAYLGTNLAGNVTSVGGIQYWVVPSSGSYKIEAYGGQGYGAFGGRGAHITGDFTLTAGDTLKILVGQMAGHYLNYPSTTYNHQFGGGGGSFVTTINNAPLVVAGGGGGNHGTSYFASCDGQITQNGASGANAATVGAGGTGGMGGLQATSADGGGGLLGNGTGGAPGQAFINGGLGGIDEGTGGFGCGGGTSSWNNYRGGGGGGYSGGGNNGGSCCPAGGGGGSYNGGTNPVDLAGVQIGDGLVRITSLTRPANNAGIDDILGFAPPVCKGIYPVEVVVKNLGNNQITSVTVEWSINGAVQTPTTYTSLIDTANGSGFDTARVVLGNANINTATTIKAWTSMPNIVLDTSNYDDTLEIMIAAPAVASAAVSADVSCNGLSDGIATVSASGGTAPYTFNWSNGDVTATSINLAAGQYFVTITDSTGCTDVDTVLVSQPLALGSVAVVNNISCNGETDGNIIISPTGGTSGYSILWNNGSTATFLDSLPAATYSYTITDANGCTFSDSSTIIEPSAISLSAVVTPETVPGNGAIDLTVAGGTSGYTFNWSNGATTEDITGLTPGTYTVTVTDANGCTATLSDSVSTTVAIEEFTGITFEVFPNPNKGSFKVRIGEITEAIQIEVFDLLGKQLMQINNASQVTEINLDVENGIYLVKISNGNKAITKRVVIAK